MDRRTFVKRGLLGGVVLGIGSATGLAFHAPAAPPAPDGLAVLSAKAYQVLVALAVRVLPSGAAPEAAAKRVDVALTYAAPEPRADFRRLLELFDNPLVALMLSGDTTPFTQASPAAQDAIFAGWQTSALTLRRSGYQAIRRLLLSAHYANPPSWPSIGYAGPPNTGGLVYNDSKWGT